MSIGNINNASTPAYQYQGFTYEPGSITDGGTLRADRDYWKTQAQTPPSFVEVLSKEELLQSWDEQVKSNADKKMTIREMLETRPFAREQMYSFVGSSKSYTFNEYVRKMEKHLKED